MSDDDIHNLKVMMARLEERLKGIDAKIDLRLRSIDERLRGAVTQEEFKLVRMIIYGAIGAVVMGVVGAVLALVIRTP